MDEFGSALKSGVRADQLPDWRLARSVLPVADLARRLFAGGEADTALKLVVLFALAKVEGRFSRERVRTLLPGLKPERLDPLVTSLYQGGWLELRASDNSYRLKPLGLYFLSVLSAAQFAGQSPANLLIRAVETVAWGDRIDEETTGHLLAMLLGELETQAERARHVLREGTPRQLVRFSRTEVRDQVQHVMQVLSAIEERTDAGSEHFGRIVRIHEALQAILRAHEGLGRRLADWNLKQLETSESGYSLAALGDACIGASDQEMEAILKGGIVQATAPTVCLVTDMLLTRHRTSRSTLRREKQRFTYEPPPPAAAEPLELTAVDPLARLRERLEGLPPDAEPTVVTRALLADTEDFADAAWLLNLLSRFEGAQLGLRLDGGRNVHLRGRHAAEGSLSGLTRDEALQTLMNQEVLLAVGGGLHTVLEVRNEPSG